MRLGGQNKNLSLLRLKRKAMIAVSESGEEWLCVMREIAAFYYSLENICIDFLFEWLQALVVMFAKDECQTSNCGMI